MCRMVDESGVKSALAALTSNNTAEVEAALGLLSVAVSAPALQRTSLVKLMCSKEARKKICSTCMSCSVGALRNSVAATAAVLTCLWEMSESSKVCSRQLQFELGSRCLINILKKPMITDEIQRLACELLRVIASFNSKFGLSMRLEGGVEVFCDIVAGSPESVHTMIAACGLLESCCTSSENNIKIAHKRGRVVGAVLAYLKAKQSSPIVCETLIKLLASIANGGERYCKSIADGGDGALELIVGLLRRHADDSDTAFAALTLIHALAADAQRAVVLCSAGAFTASWSAAGKHAQDQNVLRAAVSAMWQLVTGMHKVGKPGGTQGVASQTTSPASSPTAGSSSGGLTAAEEARALYAATTFACGYSLAPALMREPLFPKVVHAHSLLVNAAAAALRPPSGLPSTSSPTSAMVPSPTILHPRARLDVSWEGHPPATLTLWPLPSRYQSWHPSGLIPFHNLQRWTAPHLPRTGFYPPLPAAGVMKWRAGPLSAQSVYGSFNSSATASSFVASGGAAALSIITPSSAMPTISSSGRVDAAPDADDDGGSSKSITMDRRLPIGGLRGRAKSASHGGGSRPPPQSSFTPGGELGQGLPERLIQPSAASQKILAYAYAASASSPATSPQRSSQTEVAKVLITVPDQQADQQLQQHSDGGGSGASLSDQHHHHHTKSMALDAFARRNDVNGSLTVGDGAASVDGSNGGTLPNYASPTKSAAMKRRPGFDVERPSTSGPSAMANRHQSSRLTNGKMQQRDTRAGGGSSAVITNGAGTIIMLDRNVSPQPDVTVSGELSTGRRELLDAVMNSTAADTFTTAAQKTADNLYRSYRDKSAPRDSTGSGPASGLSRDSQASDGGRYTLPHLNSGFANSTAGSSPPVMSSAAFIGAAGSRAVASPNRLGYRSPPSFVRNPGQVDLSLAGTGSGVSTLITRSSVNSSIGQPMSAPTSPARTPLRGIQLGTGAAAAGPTSFSPGRQHQHQLQPRHTSSFFRDSDASVTSDRSLAAASAPSLVPMDSGVGVKKDGARLPLRMLTNALEHARTSTHSQATVTGLGPPSTVDAQSSQSDDGIGPFDAHAVAGVISSAEAFPWQSEPASGSSTSRVAADEKDAVATHAGALAAALMGVRNGNRGALNSYERRDEDANIDAIDVEYGDDGATGVSSQYSSRPNSVNSNVMLSLPMQPGDTEAPVASSAAASPTSPATSDKVDPRADVGSGIALRAIQPRVQPVAERPIRPAAASSFVDGIDREATQTATAVANKPIIAFGTVVSRGPTSTDAAGVPSQPNTLSTAAQSAQASAWETARVWLRAPHWFAELQMAAALLPEVAPYRSLQGPVKNAKAASLSGPWHLVDASNPALQQVEDQCRQALVQAKSSGRPAAGRQALRSRAAAAAGAGGGGSGRNTGFHPAACVPPIQVQSAQAVNELVGAASAAVLARITSSTGKYKFDPAVALERRTPNAPLLPLTLVSSGVSDIDKQLMPNIRVPRVYITRSGMASVRRFVVPPNRLPTAFHCHPPVARLAPSVIVGGPQGPVTAHRLLLPSAGSANDSAMVAAGIAVSGVSSFTHPLIGGYLLGKRIPIMMAPGTGASSSLRLDDGVDDDVSSDIVELPEPMLVNTTDQRATVSSRLILRAIARAGVAAGQLMSKRLTGIVQPMVDRYPRSSANSAFSSPTSSLPPSNYGSRRSSIDEHTGIMGSPNRLLSAPFGTGRKAATMAGNAMDPDGDGKPLPCVTRLVYHRYSEPAVPVPALLVTPPGQESGSASLNSNGNNSPFPSNISGGGTLLTRCDFSANELASAALPIPNLPIGEAAFVTRAVTTLAALVKAGSSASSSSTPSASASTDATSGDRAAPLSSSSPTAGTTSAYLSDISTLLDVLPVNEALNQVSLGPTCQRLLTGGEDESSRRANANGGGDDEDSNGSAGEEDDAQAQAGENAILAADPAVDEDAKAGTETPTAAASTATGTDKTPSAAAAAQKAPAPASAQSMPPQVSIMRAAAAALDEIARAAPSLPKGGPNQAANAAVHGDAAARVSAAAAAAVDVQAGAVSQSAAHAPRTPSRTASPSRPAAEPGTATSAAAAALPPRATPPPQGPTPVAEAIGAHSAVLRAKFEQETIARRDVSRILSEAADDVAAMATITGAAEGVKIGRTAAISAPHVPSPGGISKPATTPASQAKSALPGAAGNMSPTTVNLTLRAEMLTTVPALEFESRFECGNLCSAVRVGPFEYELTLDPDTNTAGHTQWFFFRVQCMVGEDASLMVESKDGRYQRVPLYPIPDRSLDGTGYGPVLPAHDLRAMMDIDSKAHYQPPPCVYRFHIVNLEKGGSTFNDGMRPLVYFQSAATPTDVDNAKPRSKDWRRWDPPVDAPPGLEHLMARLAAGGVHDEDDGTLEDTGHFDDDDDAEDAAAAREGLHGAESADEDSPVSRVQSPRSPSSKRRSRPMKYVPACATGESYHVPTLPGDGWRRAGFDIVYYRNQYSRLKEKVNAPCMDNSDGGDASTGSLVSVPGGAFGEDGPKPTNQYTQSFSVTFPAGCHTAFFAYCFPYTYTDLRRDVVRWEGRAERVTTALASLSATALTSGEAGAASPTASTAAVSEELAMHIREWDNNAAVGDVDGLELDAAPNSNTAGTSSTTCRIRGIAGPAGFSAVPTPFASRLPAAGSSTGSWAATLPLATQFMSGILHRSVLCHSLAGNPVPLLTITDFTSLPAALAVRPYVVLSARVHPGETNGSWMMRGVIDFLTSTAPIAIELRRRAVFKIVPFLNPDGVINGHHRTGLAGLDLNRHWTTPDINKAPTIWHLRSLIMAIQNRAGAQGLLANDGAQLESSVPDDEVKGYGTQLQYPQQQQQTLTSGAADGGSPVSCADASPSTGAAPEGSTEQLPILPPVPQPCVFFCDFHGHSRRRNVFTFGCHELAPEGRIPIPGELPAEGQAGTGPSTRLFPKLLASRVDTFAFKDCSWRVQKDKNNCARVAMWRDALLPAAYTIEASFAGCDTGSRKGVHFSTRQYEEVGYAFCLALMDYLEGPQGTRMGTALQGLKKGSGNAAPAAGAAAVQPSSTTVAAQLPPRPAPAPAVSNSAARAPVQPDVGAATATQTGLVDDDDQSAAAATDVETASVVTDRDAASSATASGTGKPPTTSTKGPGVKKTIKRRPVKKQQDAEIIIYSSSSK